MRDDTAGPTGEHRRKEPPLRADPPVPDGEGPAEDAMDPFVGEGIGDSGLRYSNGPQLLP